MTRKLLISAGLVGLIAGVLYLRSEPAPEPAKEAPVQPLSAQLDAKPKEIPVPAPSPRAPAKDVAKAETPVQTVARLRLALAKNPKDARLMAELGVTLARDLHSPQEGIPYLEESLRTDSSNGTAFYDAVGAYLDAGQVERGVAFLEELLSSDVPNKGAASAALADLLATSGDSQAATEYARAAAETDPNPATMGLVGSVELQNGNEPAAEESFRMRNTMQQERIRQIQASGGDATGEIQRWEEDSLDLVDVYLRRGNWNEARALLSQLGESDRKRSLEARLSKGDGR